MCSSDLSGMQKQSGGAMRHTFRMQAMQKAQIVHMPSNFRKQIGHQFARLSTSAELPQWLHQLLLRDLAEVTETHTRKVDALTMSGDQFGFAVKRIHMAGPALHEYEDDAFGSRHQQRQSGGGGADAGTRLFGCGLTWQ